ncbi:MAG: hypothetical protein ACREEV_19265, partial [Dongiaceae bacterium]
MADAGARSRPDWHGRRHGRRLTSHRQSLVAERLPLLRIPLPPEARTIDPTGLFPQRPSAIWLEIGFGNGEHLVEQARRHPEIGFIGSEVFVNGVASLLRHIERLGLTNVRIFDDDARVLLRGLPEASIDRMFLLFPDPWPKARHAKRRFIVPANLAILAHLLADGHRILFHGHCHQKAEVGTAATVELLRRIPGADVVELDAGC